MDTRSIPILLLVLPHAGSRDAEQDGQERAHREHVDSQRPENAPPMLCTQFLGWPERVAVPATAVGRACRRHANTGTSPGGSARLVRRARQLGVPPTARSIAAADRHRRRLVSWRRRRMRGSAHSTRAPKSAVGSDLTENGRAVPITYQARNANSTWPHAGGGRPARERSTKA